MFTYQVRKRIFKFYQDEQIIFPAEVKLIFILNPLQPFGMEYDGGLTAIEKQQSFFQIDTNTGHISIISEEALTPISTFAKDDTYTFNISGNRISTDFIANSKNYLEEIIQSLFFQLPIILNIEYIDTPYINRVEGIVANNCFGWEFERREVHLEVTNKNIQEEKAIESWKKYLFLNNDTKYRRVYAALHYFHVACRLTRVGNSPWEFMSEVLLNYCKILEVLFPAEKTIDKTKLEMGKLGFSTQDIDTHYIPSIALRNQIDVAHVDLATYETEDLEILHKYTELAEPKFRKLLKVIIENIQNGSYTILEYTKEKPKKDKLSIINIMRNNFK